MIRMISMMQLETLLGKKKDMTLLDVRSREEFSQGALRGAVNIPLEELEERLDELNPEYPTVIYCARGSKSLMAARFLDEMGFWAIACAGGLAGYHGRFYVDRHL